MEVQTRPSAIPEDQVPTWEALTAQQRQAVIVALSGLLMKQLSSTIAPTQTPIREAQEVSDADV